MLRAAVSPVGVEVVNRWLGFRHRFELVADAVARLDERVARCGPVDLLAEPANENVDGAVAVRLTPPPKLLQQLVARRHAAGVERQLVEQPELGRRQLRALAVDVGLNLARVDPQLFDLDRLAAWRLVAPDASACGGADTRATSSFIENGFTR